MPKTPGQKTSSNSSPVYAEEVFRLFLDSPFSKKGDPEIFSYVLDYLSNFDYEEDLTTDDLPSEKSTDATNLQKKSLFEDFSSYEVDDFIYFYLEDNFENFQELQKKSINLFKRFLKFAVQKKLLPAEDRDEWEEVLNS